LSDAHPALAHQSRISGKQREVATLGMWVFLVTELLFFGGLFLTYAIYRRWYPADFAAASHELIVWAGTLNTVVLITSSLTMALAVHAAEAGHRARCCCCSSRPWRSMRVSGREGVRISSRVSPRITFPAPASSSTQSMRCTHRSSSRSTSS